MVKVKTAPLIMLGSVVGIAGGFGIYWYYKKAKTRNITLTVSPGTVEICRGTFRLEGTVTDGFGRPVVGALVYIWYNGTKHERPVITDVNGRFFMDACFHTGGTHVPATGSQTVTFKAQVDNYFSPEAVLTLTYTECQSCDTCPV